MGLWKELGSNFSFGIWVPNNAAVALSVGAVVNGVARNHLVFEFEFELALAGPQVH